MKVKRRTTEVKVKKRTKEVKVKKRTKEVKVKKRKRVVRNDVGQQIHLLHRILRDEGPIDNPLNARRCLGTPV
jgi:hypothetical protein